MIKIKTDILKDLVNKASKGITVDKLIPITNFMCIKYDSGEFVIITTDSTNYMYARRNFLDCGDEFYAVVNTDIFTKLISNITSEYITLGTIDNILMIEGNGKYKIPLSLDEDGFVIKFKDPMKDVNLTDDLVHINVNELRNVIKTLKPSLYTRDNNIPFLSKYYFGDCVLASDKEQVSCYSKNFTHEPVLLSQYMLNILDVITSDTIGYAKTDKYVILSADGVTMYGVYDIDVSTFPASTLKKILDADGNSISRCKINKSEFMDALKRINLFVGNYDNNVIGLKFNTDGIEISSKSSAGVEFIEYVELSNYSPCECYININMLMSQLKAYPNDTVDFGFGHELFVSLRYKDFTQIIALVSKN